MAEQDDTQNATVVAHRQMIAQLMALTVLGPDAREALVGELLREETPSDGTETDPVRDEMRRVIREASRLIKEARGTPNAADPSDSHGPLSD